MRAAFLLLLSALPKTPLAAEPFRLPADSSGDPVVLVGDYSPAGSQNVPLLVLLHGLGSSRGEWQPLVDAAKKRGWGTLAYDLRGHGESRRTTEGLWVDYVNPRFGRDPAFWRRMVDDLLAMATGVEKRADVVPGRMVFIGASLGANICLLAGDRRPVAGLVLLSPGLDYAGLQTETAITRLRTPALLIAARPDRYAFASASRLAERAPTDRVETLLFDRGGPQGAHGVQLFDGNLERRILDWIGGALKARGISGR